MLDKTLKIVARNSNLSLVQVKEAMSWFGVEDYVLKTLPVMGDKDKSLSLMSADVPEDFFTRELDECLLKEEADIAVHSAKDLPFPLREGIEVLAFTPPADQRDALVSREGKTLSTLPKGARIGTSSVLRKKNIELYRSDLQIVPVRGTIEERLEKVFSGEVDALIVAACALKRLKKEALISEYLPFSVHPLQGYLAVTARKGVLPWKHVFLQKDYRKHFGKVWIVGAGPGDPGLITVKGWKILQNSDVVLYDALVNTLLLKSIPGKKICVGKRGNGKHFPQQEILYLLTRFSMEGKIVVRLKGGDPALFAYLYEEMEWLARHYIPFEIIPGITAASAASALGGFPLTRRQKARSVAFITAHQKEINIPQADTLVFYMGGMRASQIASLLIHQKKFSPATPVCIASHVSNPSEKFIFTTLEALRNNESLPALPALIIVGDVVETPVRHIYQQQGKILDTSTGYPAVNIRERLYHQPFIEIKEEKQPQLGHLIKKYLVRCDMIIFTSRWAVSPFFKGLYISGQDARSLSGKMIIAIGKTTANQLVSYGIKADIIPTSESACGIVKEFEHYKWVGRKILWPSSDKALPLLKEALEKMGNEVYPLVVYHNKKPRMDDIPDLSEFKAIFFSSPSAVDNFFQVYGKIPSHLSIIARGKTTRSSLNKHQCREVLTLKEYKAYGK